MGKLEDLRESTGDPRTLAAIDLLEFLGKDIPVHTAAGFSGKETYVDTAVLHDRSGPWSGGERRMVNVALSLLGHSPVDLNDSIGGLGGAHLEALQKALIRATS